MAVPGTLFVSCVCVFIVRIIPFELIHSNRDGKTQSKRKSTRYKLGTVCFSSYPQIVTFVITG